MLQNAPGEHMCGADMPAVAANEPRTADAHADWPAAANVPGAHTTRSTPPPGHAKPGVHEPLPVGALAPAGHQKPGVQLPDHSDVGSTGVVGEQYAPAAHTTTVAFDEPAGHAQPGAHSPAGADSAVALQ